MVRKLTAIAETGHYKSAGFASGVATVSILTTIISPVRSGGRAWQFNAATNGYARFGGDPDLLVPSGTTLSLQFWVRIPTSVPTGVQYLANILLASGTPTIQISPAIRNDGSGGYLRFWNHQGSVNLGDSAAGSIVGDIWYRVRLSIERTTTTTSV